MLPHTVNHMIQPSSFKPDRYDQDARLRVRAISMAAALFVIGAVLFNFLGQQLLCLSGWRLHLMTLSAAGTLAGIAYFFGWTLPQTAGKAAGMVYMGGDNTPYEEQFSEEQALVMKSKFAEALELFEHKIALSPGEPRVRIAAADLYATHGKNPKRAAELYREVQRIEGLASGHDVYVTNKLADLFLGPLKSPGKALVEFRRLESRYPGTAVAKNAVLAIKNLKPQIVAGTEGPPPDVWDQAKLDKSTPKDTPGMPGY